MSRKKSVSRQKSGGRKTQPRVKSLPQRMSATEWIKADEDHHERRAKQFGKYDKRVPEADLPPLPDKREKSLFIPAYVDQDQNRNWQAKCVYLLFTNQYWSDVNYSFNAAGKKIEVALFDNGRERGYTFRDRKTGKEISFAENRNSDSIVVYPFKWADAIKDPYDTAYKNETKRYKPKEFYEVFTDIIRYFDAEF